MRPASTPDNTLFRFHSVEEFFAVLFGPAQHDSHVEAWRYHLRDVEDWRRLTILGGIIDERIEQACQNIAAQHNYDTGRLRHELNRYRYGSLSGMIDAPTRIKHLKRALDIALARHDVPMAAE